MTSTSATTITVNTGLFAAGDTVFIQNLGSGNLTITAGTATVATAGSLILPQNDAGILYFVSTSSSVFYDFIQVGATSPLTTKGDLYGFSTLDARIPIGANNTVLTADSGETLGLKWATPSGGGGITKILATTFSAVSSYSAPAATFSATYNQYTILFEITSQSANADIQMRLRTGGSDETANSYTSQVVAGSSSSATATQTATTFWNFGNSGSNTRFAFRGDFFNPFGTGQHLHTSEVFRLSNASAFFREANGGRLDTGTSYDAFTLFPASGTITGRIAVYGYSL
jgi:hypothetical protein